MFWNVRQSKKLNTPKSSAASDVYKSQPLGWLLWGLAHLAFIPASENRITLLTKWLWMIATRERPALLITER